MNGGKLSLIERRTVMSEFDKEKFINSFTGVPKDRLEKAIKTADTLSKNPEVRNSFSKISEKEIKEMLSALSENDTKKAELLAKKADRGLFGLIEKLKNSI